MKLFYREFGSGLPLVILHGLYGSSDNWVSIAKQLSHNFRVILPDQRNHGLSPHNPDHSYQSLAGDLKELCISLSVDNFFLAGHSMGGKTALKYAELWPEDLMGLAVIDISPFRAETDNNPIADFHLTVLNELCSLNVSALQSREEADIILSEKIKSARIRSFLLKNLTRDNNSGFRLKLNPENLRANISNIMDGIERDSTPDDIIRGFPIKWLRAAESGYITESDIGLIEMHYPSAEVITIENSSHWIHAEQADRLVEILFEFIE
jgi:pimeloyl-ACP methyl ester carboxylesterase